MRLHLETCSADMKRVLNIRSAVFDYGFRPFFLAAGLCAFALIPIWLYFFVHHGVAFGALPAMYWHAHEMLYGFAGAAVAGFLLTAVPSWTGTRGFAGRPLYLLSAAWIAGRVAMGMVAHVPFWVVALLELAFLPLLAAVLAPPLFRSENGNRPMLVVLGVLWMIDVAFLVGLYRGDVVLASRAISLAINCVLILVTVIGGRIVPAFTANALRRSGEAGTLMKRGWVEQLTIGSMIAITIVDAIAPHGYLSMALAAIASIAHVIRLSGWRSFKTGGESILWILHMGYAWLPIGLALKACFLFGSYDWASKWQHALTAGVFGTMILAVMTRASLGHTGRPLVVAPSITIAYVVLTLSVCLRVFSAALPQQHYVMALSIAGLGWALAFLLFLIVYAPILIGPRADGKPG
jgi:uncharacterized protein involved in response to NO